MNDNIDLIIEKTRGDFLSFIQNTNLPPSIIYYLVKDVYISIQKEYFSYLNNLVKQDEQKQAEKINQDLSDMQNLSTMSEYKLNTNGQEED